MTSTSIAVVLHIAFGSLWFGGPLVMGSVLKKTAAAGRPAFVVGTQLAARMSVLTLVGLLGVLVTGPALIFLSFGGMGGAPVRFHIALGLVLVGLAVGLGLLRPTVSGLVKLAADPNVDMAAATGKLKRVSMGVGINHLLWLVCLVLMYAA